MHRDSFGLYLYMGTLKILKISLTVFARFINTNCYWNSESLSIAFDNICSYYSVEKFKHLEPEFFTGYPTPLQPYNLSSCILYAGCKYYKAKCLKRIR